MWSVRCDPAFIPPHVNSKSPNSTIFPELLWLPAITRTASFKHSQPFQFISCHLLTPNAMPANPQKLRSLYRSFLRELPSRGLAARSPLQSRIRSTIASENTTTPEHAEQFLQYVKSQRMYATLVERYNPGMNMDEEERVKLTARKVGMDLPVEYDLERDGPSEKK